MELDLTSIQRQLENITRQVTAITTSKDAGGRQLLQDSLIKLQHALETPFDTLMRIYDLSFQHAAARIACDMKIFVALAVSEKPLTLQEISLFSGAAEQLMGRVLRYLASVGMIDELDKDLFIANKMTKILSHPDYEGGIRLSFDVQGPTNAALPDFLVEKGFKDITSPTDTAFNKAWGSKEPFFTFIRSQPRLFEHLRHALDVQYRESWLVKFPLQDYLGGFESSTEADKVLFVDIGGNLGIQCRAVQEKFPHINGRIILEDLKETIDVVPEIQGVEKLAQDYLSAQQVHGAKFYYYRNIFHDNPNSRCRLILDGLRPAMREGSLLLIDDKVLPNKGISRHVTMLDLAMMAQVASHERTLEQWEHVLNPAGWKIINIVTYSDEQDSILVVGTS